MDKIFVPQWIVARIGLPECRRLIREVRAQHRAAGLSSIVARANAISVLEVAAGG